MFDKKLFGSWQCLRGLCRSWIRHPGWSCRIRCGSSRIRLFRRIWRRPDSWLCLRPCRLILKRWCWSFPEPKWIIFAPASWICPAPAKAIEIVAPFARSPFKDACRVFHVEHRADIAVDPFHVPFRFHNRPFRHQIDNIGGPVLDRRITAIGTLADDDFHYRRMEEPWINRRRAPFNIMQARPSSTIINVLSNWPILWELIRK